MYIHGKPLKSNDVYFNTKIFSEAKRQNYIGFMRFHLDTIERALTKIEDQKPEFQCIGVWLVSVRIFNANGLGIFFLAELKPCDGNYGPSFGSKPKGQL